MAASALRPLCFPPYATAVLLIRGHGSVKRVGMVHQKSMMLTFSLVSQVRSDECGTVAMKSASSLLISSWRMRARARESKGHQGVLGSRRWLLKSLVGYLRGRGKAAVGIRCLRPPWRRFPSGNNNGIETDRSCCGTSGACTRVKRKRTGIDRTP